MLFGFFEHVLCLLSIQSLYDVLLDDCSMLCAGLLVALVAVLSIASHFVFLGCRSYCFTSKFVLWGILSVLILSWSFRAAGQLGVIAHCADEVVQIDTYRKGNEGTEREREREREREERKR